MLIKYYLDILAALISKAVWFLQLYISQYKELLIFIAVFVVLYIFFHALAECPLPQPSAAAGGTHQPGSGACGHRGFYADVPGSGNRTAV